MKMKLSAVVLAGGYGHFRGPRGTKVSKVTAHIGGKPMIRHIMDKLLSTHLFNRYYIVTNTLYHEQVEHALAGYPDIRFVTQPHRVGSAGAVKLALDAMEGEQHILTQCGDMPFFESGTYLKMVDRHFSGDNPKLTLIKVPCVPGTPVESYGRIIYGEGGKLLGTIDDPNCVPKGQFAHAKEVNPSLYVGEVPWLKASIPQIKPINKGDGFPDERLMQSLIFLSHNEGSPTASIPLDDHEQAYGINTLSDLRMARQLHKRRCQQRTLAA